MSSRAGTIHEAARGFEHAPKPYEIGRPPYPARGDRAARGRARAGGRQAGAGPRRRNGEADAPPRADRRLRRRGRAGRGDAQRALVGRFRMSRRSQAPPRRSRFRTRSMDAVTVGQAFHWFDGDAALAEIHRVLRPGGRLGLIWNVKDESVDWIEKLGGIMEAYRGAAPRVASGAWKDAFDRTTLFTPLQRGAVLVRARGRLRGRGRAGHLGELHRGVAAGRVRAGRRPGADAPRHAPRDEGALDLRAALPHRRLLVRARSRPSAGGRP